MLTLSPDDNMKNKKSQEFERAQEDLNPHRDEERQRVGQETVARLRSRGVALTGSEALDELADLMSAVEEFEEQVSVHGGDLMVDDLRSSQPDDPHFVLPARGDENVASYISRIDAASERLRHHPAHRD